MNNEQLVVHTAFLKENPDWEYLNDSKIYKSKNGIVKDIHGQKQPLEMRYDEMVLYFSARSNEELEKASLKTGAKFFIKSLFGELSMPKKEDDQISQLEEITKKTQGYYASN